MPLYATCSHKIKSLGTGVWVAAYDRENKRCIDFMFLCKKCYKKYDNYGLLLKTQGEKNEWLENYP